MFNGFSAVPGAVVPYAYDWLLVGLSYLISVAGAYVGLRWSRRVRNKNGTLDMDRLICASVALGGRGGLVHALHRHGGLSDPGPD